MIESPSLDKTTTTKPPKSTAFLLLLTIFDTTWRAFVPTIGSTVLGVVLDNSFHMAPIFTFILIPVGFVISALLITIQIKKVRRAC